MAPPVDVLNASTTPPIGVLGRHQNFQARHKTSQHQERNKLSERRHHSGGGSGNRRKIRRQGSLKTIQEENMPLPPSTMGTQTEQQLVAKALRTATSTKSTLKTLPSTINSPGIKVVPPTSTILTPVSVSIPASLPQPSTVLPTLLLLSTETATSHRHTTSAFIPDGEVPAMPSSKENNCEENLAGDCQSQAFLEDSPPSLHSLLIDSSLFGFDNLVRIMNFHPKYLEIFLSSHLHLLTGDGPLPVAHRAYIGVMAAARLKCSQLVHSLTSDFLRWGGDSSWLDGLHNAPKKLRDLGEMNKILAHRPWTVNKDHVRGLTKCDPAWSASELVHALTLLAHFHALSGFVFGSGLQRDADKPSPSPPASPCNAEGAPPSPKEGGWADAVLERMRGFKPEELSPEECVKRFLTVGSQTAELPVSKCEKVAAKSSPTQDDAIRNLYRFVDDPEFSYIDFAKSSANEGKEAHHSANRKSPDDTNHLCVQDYSWQDHGFSVLNRFYDVNGSNLLDDKFRVAENLTYNTMATHRDVDTQVFRRAIWNYIDLLFGIRHDDYDYKEINELLPPTLKKFIKTGICYPERVTKKDYSSFMRELKHSERIHVNILMLEARFQAEMLYALRAVTQHLV